MIELIQDLNARAPDILRTLGWMEVQIAILALLVLAIERWLRIPSSKIRYALWLIVLAKCLLPPFLPLPQAVQLSMTQLRDIQPVALQEVFENDASLSSWPPIWQTANLPTPVAMGLLHPRIYLNSTATQIDRKALLAVQG